jgi:uncharacterized protein (UPF0248 family)
VNTVVEKVDKKKKEVLVETAIPYDRIVKAVVKLDF